MAEGQAASVTASISIRGHGRVDLLCPPDDATVQRVQAGEPVRCEGMARDGGADARLAVDEDVAPVGRQLRRHLEHLSVRLQQVDERQRDDLCLRPSAHVEHERPPALVLHPPPRLEHADARERLCGGRCSRWAARRLAAGALEAGELRDGCGVGARLEVDRSEAHRHRVVPGAHIRWQPLTHISLGVAHEQPPREHLRLAAAEEDLQCLGGLQHADDAGEDADDARLRARGHRAGRRRLGEEVAVVGAAAVVEDRELALKPLHGAVDQRLAAEHAGVVDEVARREVVRAVDHQVVRPHQLQRVRRVQPQLVRDDADERVDLSDAHARRVHLGRADRLRGVHNLPLQVGLVDDVVVHDADGPYARGRKVHEQRRPEASAANAEYGAALEPTLALHANIVEQEVARVPPDLLVAELGQRHRAPAGLARAGGRGTARSRPG
eukprot:scaffold105543_cov78-Phaeocystis_antarctica.AAC.7